MTPAKAKVIFATHMQAARKRNLTAYELRQLSISRQVLRQQRKPAMNNSNVVPFSGKQRLVYESTGKAVSIGDKVKTFRGDTVTVLAVKPPRHSGSTGRVVVRFEDENFEQEFYPSVIGAEWKAIGKRTRQSNPKGVLIYGQVDCIYATKKQNHICDAECKRNGHRYYHKFSSKPKMYGLPDGTLLIKP